MNHTYIDFHTHTTLSDGAYTPQELCRLAQSVGIGILSITDHNYTYDLTQLRKDYPDLFLIQGAEISCLYTDSDGKEAELHVIGLGFDPNNPKIKHILSYNQPDRQPYIDAILDQLRQCGIDLGSYHDLCLLYPNRRQVGRMDIAKMMTDQGYVASVEEAFGEYIGGHGKRKAYVPNPLRYVSLEEAVTAIVDGGGATVLAHLNYYSLSDSENHKLLRYFKELSGANGAMEVYYSRYNQQQRMHLKELADRYGLMYSSASDFHGQSEDETLVNRFCAADCQPLLKFLGAF